MVGKQLSALLQILRSNGVTRYQTTALTVELGASPGPRPLPRTVSIGANGAVSTTGDEADEEDDEGDPRFLLERLGPKHFPGAKADPRKNKAQ